MITIEYVDRKQWDKGYQVIDPNSKGFKEAVESIDENKRINIMRIKNGLKPIPII